MKKIDEERIKKEFKKYDRVSSDYMGFEYFFLNENAIGSILDLACESFCKEGRKGTSDSYSKDGLTHLFKEDNFCIGAFFKDELIAFISAEMDPKDDIINGYKDLNEISGYRQCLLGNILVSSKFRGNGLSKKLLNMTEYILLRKGIYHSYIVLPSNNYFIVTNVLDCDYNIFAIDQSFDQGEEKSIYNYYAYLPLGKVRAEVPEQYSVRNRFIIEQENVLSLGFCGFKTINYKAIDRYFLSFSVMFYD